MIVFNNMGARSKGWPQAMAFKDSLSKSSRNSQLPWLGAGTKGLQMRFCMVNSEYMGQLRGDFYPILCAGVSSRMGGIEEVKSQLKKHFQTKNLGQLGYFLGIEATRCKRRTVVS
ncbi:hypothetical protein AAG906_013690 [Vitis piasezkii]